MEETVLVKLARDGSEEALKMLYEQNKNKIFGLAYQYVKNTEDAEDILQETFIKAYHSLDTYNLQEGTSFFSWLYRIGVNNCIDFLRKNKQIKLKNEQMNDIEIIPSNNENANPEYTAQQQAVRNKINKYLSALPPKQRMVFVLKHYQQLTTKEIAEYLKCTEGSVKKQLFRAVSGLKKYLKDFFMENDYEM